MSLPTDFSMPRPMRPGHQQIGPTPAQVLLLQAHRDAPAVSLLLTTEPGASLSHRDTLRLVELADEAERRLRAEPFGEKVASVLAALRAEVARASTRSPGQGLAVFASASMRQTVTLPLPVLDRVVVDPTFATRDLVRALHRTPRHLVLVMERDAARLLEGVGGDLRRARSKAFPLRLSPVGATDPSVRDSYLATLDRALGAYRALHPSPILLAGDPTWIQAMQDRSRHLDRLAGVLPGDVPRSPADLAARVRPMLESYLLSREQEALDVLAARVGSDRVASGMADAWRASRRARPRTLVVEEGLFYPARLDPDADSLVPADDVTAPDVIDDAVDELIETVLDRGGWVAMVRDGQLPAYDRVALVVD